MFKTAENLFHSSKEKELSEINILLLGETGAGKSTTLNALANYLRYDFDNASKANNPFTIVEPFKITLSDPDTGEDRIYKSGPGVGKNTNQSNSHGSSQTIATVGYTFEFKDRCRLRIIDTPGIGDTKGGDYDKENFENIMSYLEEQKELHAVVIINDGSANRKNTFFKYCNAELLTRLHKSVGKNMMFLFTFSRASNYGAGEGFTIMKNFLKEELVDKMDELTLKPGTNSFFIDNESFLFLLAEKRGYKLDPDLKETYRYGWKKSVEQLEKMMQQILAIKPHDLKQTKLLNEARKIIVEFSQPIVQVELNIRKNIEHIKSANTDWHIQDTPMDSLLKPSQTELNVVKLEEIEKACTVCTSFKCTEIIKSKDDGKNERIFKRCHEDCFCFFITPNVLRQRNILTCQAIKWYKGKDDARYLPEYSAKCKECDCDWSTHMHIYAQYKNEKVYLLERPDEVLKKLEEELETIKTCNNKFAHILSKNTRFNQNKYFLEYLDSLIEQEYQEADEEEQNMKNNKILLKQIKSDYEKNVKHFNQAIEYNKIERVPIEVVPKLKETLCHLKYSGPQFKQILKTQQKFEDKHADVEVASVPMGNSFFRLFTKF